jgi:hypothetical protein
MIGIFSVIFCLMLGREVMLLKDQRRIEILTFMHFEAI